MERNIYYCNSSFDILWNTISIYMLGSYKSNATFQDYLTINTHI